MTAQFLAYVVALLAGAGALFACATAWAKRRGDQNDPSLGVYKDQLRSLDKDVARGVVSTAEFDTLRAEIGRRALAAQNLHQAQAAPGRPWLAAACVGGLAVLGSAVVYPRLGAPGATDLPLAQRMAAAQQVRLNRISQSQAEAQINRPAPNVAPRDQALLNDLKKALETRPTSVRGFVLLADTQARLGNPVAAHTAQARVLDLKGATSTAADFQRYAEFLIVAANGYVSPTAEHALRDTLTRDATAPLARFRLGTLYEQIGRTDLQFRTWDRLARDAAPSLPFMAFIRQELPRLAELSGVQRYSLPDRPGPTAEDFAAAEDLSDADRQAMIAGMVGNLAERLAQDGGTPVEWARLIASLGVLGRTDEAAAIWGEAQQTFANDPAALDLLRQAADQAGLTE